MTSSEKDRRERARKRRQRIQAHRAASFEDAESWDLDYWQSRTPEERLSALVAIHRDIAAIANPEPQSSTPSEVHSVE